MVPHIDLSRHVLVLCTVILTAWYCIDLIPRLFVSSGSIVFCDVGQGDAALVTTPQGEQILIDGGRGNAVLDCLSRHMPVFDRTLDLVIMSHPDLDHYEGLIDVLARYRVSECHLSHIASDSQTYLTLMDLVRSRCPARFPASGDVYTGTGYLIHYLSPQGDNGDFFRVSDTERNDNSLVLLLSSADTTVLFTGDATTKVLDPLELPHHMSVDILKISHHGAANGTSEQFLRRVSPSVAVISAGANNPYGHPDEDTLKKIVRLQLPVRRTDMEGDIGFGIGITD